MKSFLRCCSKKHPLFEGALRDWILYHPHVLEIESISSVIEEKYPFVLSESNASVNASIAPINSSITASRFSVDRIALSFSPAELARQLCLVDSRLFRAIRPRELLNAVWSKRGLKHLSVNLITFIRHINCVVYFFMTSILLQSQKNDRARALSHAISVAAELFELNNFTSCYGVLASLANVCVHRLQDSWKLVSEKNIKTLTGLKEATNQSNSFAKYRKIEASVQASGTVHSASRDAHGGFDCNFRRKRSGKRLGTD